MARHFPNFLDAYIEYAKDDFTPDQFTAWTGLSVIAGALERNVWMVDRKKTTHPNLFVLLVGSPGVGKSQAIGPAKPLLYGLGLKTGSFKILEDVATQAGVCEEMSNLSFNREDEQYSSLYYIGSEGSDSALKNHADDFRSTACKMYDCEPLYTKTLKTKKYIIPNPVLNMIVGSTFDFLGTVIDQNSVLGGLASRMTYVIDKKPLPRNSTLGEEGDYSVDKKMRDCLIEDLVQINSLYGRFKFEKGIHDLHEKWWNGYCDEVEGIESERVRSLLVRKPVLLKKIMMLHSIAESDELGIRVKHLEKAIELVETVTKNTTQILTAALMAQKDNQSGLNQVVLQYLKRRDGKCKVSDLKRALMINGNDSNRIQSTIDQLAGAEMIRLEGTSDVTLLIDPDRNL